MTEDAHTMVFFDMHCHLDFAENAAEVAAALSVQGCSVLSATVTPLGYVRAREMFAAYPQVHVGLGMHPWWVDDGRTGADAADMALFESLAPRVSIIAEVGLDFAPKRAKSFARQKDVFVRVLRAACVPQGGACLPKLFSIHAVKAAHMVLDLLEREGVFKEHLCVFHWFSGSSDELTRAVRAGCYFSVNERMLSTRRGQAYACSIPENRLLLETDEPPQGSTYSATDHAAKLSRTINMLAAIRKTDVSELAAGISQNSAHVLGIN